MGNRVEKVQTNVSETQLIGALIDAWKKLFGTTSTKEQVSLILAQNTLETGARKYMWNYNIGNLTTDGKGSYDYWTGLDWLYVSIPNQSGFNERQRKTITLKYRAYPTLQDGVLDYLRLLSQSKHYAAAWQHILHPDPTAYSKSLKEAGYYTADESAYTKPLTQLYNKFNKSNSYEKANNGEITHSPNITNTNMNTNTNKINDTLDQYIQMINSASLKKLYKQVLPTHNILIKVDGSDYTNNIELSRILCAVLQEELSCFAHTCSDTQSIEIDCAIQGPRTLCFDTIKQLSENVKETFANATKLNLDISLEYIYDKVSSHYPLTITAASAHYRKFLLSQMIRG